MSGMTLQERLEFARTAAERITRGPGTDEEKRAALFDLRAEVDRLVESIPAQTWSGQFLKQYKEEQARRGSGSR